MFLKQFILVASSLGACAEYKKIPQQQTFQQYQIVFCNTTPNVNESGKVIVDRPTYPALAQRQKLITSRG